MARSRRCSATRCPARLKPRAIDPPRREAERDRTPRGTRRPTCRTPARFSVPLLMLTTSSSRATACGAWSSTAAAMRRSTDERTDGLPSEEVWARGNPWITEQMVAAARAVRGAHRMAVTLVGRSGQRKGPSRLRPEPRNEPWSDL